MTYVDILIPLVPGILLVAFPEALTRAKGDALNREKKRLRKIGFLLIAAAACYAIVKIAGSVSR